MKAGQIDDSRVLEMLEFGDTDVSLDNIRLEKIKTNEENIKMSLGQPCIVEFFELHSVAVNTHTEFMLSAEFEQLEEPIQMMFKQHLAEHLNFIQQQIMKQQAQQMQATEQPQGNTKQ